MQDGIKVAVVHPYREPFKTIVHERQFPNMTARFAFALIEKWGMVAAKEGGEDSAGRAKLSLLSVQEVVDRACNTAELAMQTVTSKGWMAEVPSYEECVSIANEEKKKDKIPV